MINISLVQTNITSTEQNFKKIREYIYKAIENKSDIVLFPEFALQYYTSPSEQPTFDQLKQYLIKIGSICQKGSIYAIVPAVIKENGKRFNCSFLINPEGKIQFRYEKQCLFWKEKDIAKATAGSLNEVVDVSFGKIGLLQCYDIYSPDRLDRARPLVKEGAQILFIPSDSVHYDYPSKENKEDIIQAPHILATQLHVPVVVCDTYRPKPENADPADLENEYSLCYSRAVLPNDEIVGSIKDEEGIISFEIEI